MSNDLRWAAIAGVSALAIGALAGSLLLPPIAPPSAEASPATQVVPVVARSFEDSRTLTATPAVAPETTVLSSGPGGVVTASSCAPGAAIAFGSRLFSVDGVVRLAIVSDVPLWRDLAVGSKGSDVRGLQRALAADGYDVDASGMFDRATETAVEDMQEAAAVTTTGKVSLDRAQWVPRSSSAVASCAAGVGSVIGTGQPLLALGGDLASLTLPADAVQVPGREYVAVVGDVAVPIPDDRRLLDQAFLDVIESSNAFAQWKQDPTKGLPVSVRLADPIDAIGVPPSAVVLTDSRTGCVVAADGSAVLVEVLASELGTVFVVPDELVGEVVTPAAEVILACG